MRKDISHLSPEEQQKILNRRKKNKQAVQKSRDRRTEYTAFLANQCVELEEQNRELEEETKGLLNQKKNCEFVLAAHLQSQTCKQQQTSQKPSSGINSGSNQSLDEKERCEQGGTLSTCGIFGDSDGNMLVLGKADLQEECQDSNESPSTPTFL